MESLDRLTRQINVFVRFFESINCLFWQLRWLQDNIRFAKLSTLLTVAIIVGMCIVLLVPAQGLESFAAPIDAYLGLPAGAAVALIRVSPIILVVVVVSQFLLRRWRIGAYEFESVNETDVEDGGGDRKMSAALPSAPTTRHYY